MNIISYLNQEAILKTVTVYDTYANKTFANSVIKIRFQDKRRLIKTADGKDVMSNGLIFSLVELKEDDELNYNNRNYTVVQCEPIIKLDGKLSHYESYVV